jgi:hypothetical protein
LKLDVKRRLDEIAADSKAFICVVNVETMGGVGGTVLATADGHQGANDSPKLKSGADDPTTSTATEDGSAPPSVDGAPADAAENKSPEKAPTQSSVGPVTFGLETERMCELVITGGIENVEVAKLRLLVMLDELVRCPGSSNSRR